MTRDTQALLAFAVMAVVLFALLRLAAWALAALFTAAAVVIA